MIKKLLPFYLVALVILSLAVIYGCGANPTGGGGGGTSHAHGRYSYLGTQSPGDIWKWTIDTGTFSGTNETTGFWVTGTWEPLSSGFGKAFVSTSEGPGAVPVGSLVYFLEFPDTMLVVHPASIDETKANVIACAARSTDQPIADKKYVAVNMPRKSWKYDTDDAYGYVHLQANGDSPDLWDLGMVNFILDGSLPSTLWNATAESYADGVFSGGYKDSLAGSCPPRDVSNLNVFITPSKIYLGDYGPDEGGFVGVYIPDDYTFDSIEASTHEFKGLEFKYYADSATGETHPISLSSADPGTLNIHRYRNDDVGSTPFSTTEATLALGTYESDTMIISSEMTDGSTTPIKAVMARIGSARKYVYFGIGACPDGTPINLFIVQSD